jgi:hypothetical protein
MWQDGAWQSVESYALNATMSSGGLAQSDKAVRRCLAVNQVRQIPAHRFFSEKELVQLANAPVSLDMNPSAKDGTATI